MNATNSPAFSAADSLAAAQPDINATVSASAGTGKTWLLVTRIIRLLLADAEPGSILALTFTRKAAAEMQMRLQERLFQLATADDKELSKLLLQTGSTDTRETMKKSRQLYEKLLHAGFPVRLQTFHSFCQDILSHFPLEADITPGFELIESTALLQQQAWEELFAEATRNTQGLLANDLDVLMQACNGPANTKAALNSMLGHRSDWWAYTEQQKDAAAYASDQLQRQLQITPTTDPYAELFTAISRDDFICFADLLRKHETKTNLAHAEQLERALQADHLNEASFKLLLPVFLTARHEPRSRKTSKAQLTSMGAQGEATFLELHVRICESLQHTLDISRRMQTLTLNAAWYRTGLHFIKLYQKIKRELRLLDFTDLEWSCYRLLNHANNAHWVQYKIDQRINHVLIDEFQDTNPTQWQLITPLLEEIAAGPGERTRSFFLVGDEKQSIYSFRRANPELQHQASAYLAQSMAAVEVKLDASRRSSPAVIETVNAIFSQDEIRHYMADFTTHSTHLHTVPGRISLFPLHQLDTDDEHPPDDPGAMQLRNPLLQPRTENLKTARIDEAHSIAQQIEKLVNEPALICVKDEDDNTRTRPLEYGDIMILMRNRTHIGVYESVLREHGIPFIGSQRGSLLDNQEIQDMERLLDSLITPFNNLSIAQVLKSPMFAASDQDLITISLLHKDSKWFERLLNMQAVADAEHPLSRAARLLPHWHKLADTMPVHDLLDRIYAEGNIIQRYVSSVPPAQQQRVSANLQRFHQLSLEIDSGRYPSISHFLHYLRSLREHKNDRPDEPAVVHGQSRVKLMTIHASKGLESPAVFLVDCDNQGAHHDAFSALVDWPAESNKPVKFQLITSKDNIDKMTNEVLVRKQQAHKREELNLLYVALTRARQYLQIFGSASKSKSGWYEYIETAMKTLTTPDVDGAYHYSVGEFSATINNAELPRAATKIAIDTRLNSPIVDATATEYMIAPSLGFHAGDDGALSANDSDGIKRGIAIHRALDLMSRIPPLTTEQARQQIRHESALVDEAELNSWLKEAGNTINNGEFENIFKPYAAHQVLNELPVMYRQNNQTVYGIIDRLVVTDDHVLLIDYKTHQIEDEAQLQSLAGSYAYQMRLYTTGIEKLWPGQKIKSGLLFTHSARLIWIDQDL